jgi:predicted flavoprotein YhiN
MPDGRMFPADGKAATIVHAFGDLLRDEGVPILTNCPVSGLSDLAGGILAVHTPNFDILAENVIIATGGVSYPKTGSVGDGQNFARTLGHKLVPYRPGLIGLETQDRRIISLAGKRFEDGRAKVLDTAGKVVFDYRGEVDCESFGLSGAAVYNSQRFIEHAKMHDYSIEVWFGHERLTFRNLKPRPVKEAIVTIGGVSLDDVDPCTMQSRKVPGVYFAGEVLDIDGPTGGYNLTMAFATARKAVVSI